MRDCSVTPECGLRLDPEVKLSGGSVRQYPLLNSAAGDYGGRERCRFEPGLGWWWVRSSSSAGSDHCGGGRQLSRSPGR